MLWTMGTSELQPLECWSLVHCFAAMTALLIA
jgi:hypothetical protein